jgi:hypothetical protein
MPVSVNGTNGGSVTLTSGAASSATTLTLPNVSGTVLQTGTTVTVAQGGTGATSLTANNVILGNGASAVQTVAPGTSGNILTSTGTTWASSPPAATGLPAATAVGHIPFSTNGSTYTATQKIFSDTVQASTSAAAIDFTSIPSWAKRITIMFNGVSTSGVSPVIIQLGTSAGFEVTSYASVATRIGGGSSATSAFTTGLGNDNFIIATNVRYGAATITLLQASSNAWTYTSSVSDTTTTIQGFGAGYKALSATLTRVRITTVNGTDTFDAGSINILYE